MMAVLTHMFVPPAAFAPDQITYDSYGLWLSQYWWGESLDFPSRLTGSDQPIGYFYIVGILYFVFGHLPLVPKLVNCVIGALTVAVAFDLARGVSGDQRVALRAATYVAFFPSLVLWSALNIRDAWVLLLLLLICRLALDVQERFSPRPMLLLSCAVLALTQFRSYLLFAVTLPMVVSIIAMRRRNVLGSAIIGMLLATVIIFADAAAGSERRMRIPDLEDLSSSRQWSAGVATSGFARDVVLTTPAAVIGFLPLGMTYFLLAPFPWQLSNLRQAISFPEMLFYYSLIPAMVRGCVYLMRVRLRQSLMVLLVCAGLTLGYSIGEGNVGTLYRHRAQLLPFFLIFAAVGVELKRRR